MSQFYLTLPSNSSEKYYPNNTLTDFFTKLHNDIDLSGDWEAALVEIMYPRNWFNVKDQIIKISCSDSEKIAPKGVYIFAKEINIRVPIPSGNYRSVPDLVEVIQTAIDETMKMPISTWSMTGRYSPIKDRARDIAFFDKSVWPKISYDAQNQKVVLTTLPEFTLNFPEQLSRIFDLKIVSGQGNVKSSTTCDLEGGLHAMYVYCDILECIPVGDTMTPLLRIVEIKGQRGEMVHIRYDQPRYVPIRKKHFDSIEIDIRDDLGQSIPFESGKLIVTLHIRKQTESYYLG
jgi:hypothetical protein